MILQAAKEFDIDLSRSLVVGDKESDIQAGVAAGVGCNLLYLPSGTKYEVETVASGIVGNLDEVGKYLNQC